MRYQSKGKPYCGPTALGNALRMYGKKVSNKKLLDVTDAAKNDGCSEFLLLQGIDALGFGAKVRSTDSTREAKLFISALAPTLLCIHTDEPWDHWVCVYPCLTGWFLFDSENNKKNARENGCHVLSWNQLVRLWRAPARAQVDPTDRTYFGIQVIR